MIHRTLSLASVLVSVAAIAASASGESFFSIASCAFDEDSLVFRMSWRASDSTALGTAYSAGITASCVPGDRNPPIASFRCVSLSNDTVFTLPRMVFDTTYTVSVWTMRDGQWAVPDSAASRAVRVTSRIKQPVSYFPQSGNDTVKALAGMLLMWKAPGYPPTFSPYDDTVKAFGAPSSTVNGFISYGIGVRFLRPPELSPSFFIALNCSAVPSVDEFSRCRLYKDSAGVLLVQREATLDAGRRRITLQTDNLAFPLIVLADTVRPVVGILSDTSRCIESDALTDTVSVEDNADNGRWSFYRAVGEEKLTAPVASGYIAGKAGKIVCPGSADGAQSGGVRAFLIVSDGTYTDTINLSHRAVRSHTDATTTPENSIVPITVSAQPDNPDLRASLSGLFSESGGAYDRSKFRIFRWFPPAAAQKSDGWIEFPGSGGGVFDCRPGALFWLITKKSAAVDFGRGTTLSLKASYTLPLSPKGWSDFCVPFGFNMPLSAVLEASGAGAENLVIYRWIPDAANRTYQAQLLFGGEIISADNVADTLFSGKGTGYTAYNPHDAAFELRFPPIPVSMKDQTSFRILRKDRSGADFCVKISAAIGGKEFPSAYCGARDGQADTVVIPEPPSFSSIRLTALRPNGRKGAIMLYPASGNGVALFPLEFANGESRPASAIIRASLIKAGTRPKEFRLLKKETDGSLRAADSITIQGAASGRYEFYLAAGERNAVESFIAGLSGSGAGPAPGISYQLSKGRLRMGLPASVLCRVSIFDINGRRIMHSVVGGAPSTVEIKLPSGVFICKSAAVNGQKTLSESRLLLVPK